MKSLEPFSQRWKQQKSVQSSIVSESKTPYQPSQTAFPPEIQQIYKKLSHQYFNVSLQDVFKGREISTSEGLCYCIENKIPFSEPAREIESTKKRLQSSLQLIPGIGLQTEHLLHHQRVFTFSQIPADSRFYANAQAYIHQIENGPYDDLFWKFHQIYGKDHPDLLQLSRLIPIENLVFVDIETMGLSSQPITLIGFGRIQGNALRLRQYFARDITEEASMLSNFYHHLQRGDFFVTFNGEYFDIPFIKNRSRYHNLDHPTYPANFDALFFARKVWKKDLPNCKLQTIEKEILNIHRIDDVPGAYCPMFYQHYLQTRQIGTVVPIIQHNQQDIVSLARIFFRLQQIWR